MSDILNRRHFMPGTDQPCEYVRDRICNKCGWVNPLFDEIARLREENDRLRMVATLAYRYMNIGKCRACGWPTHKGLACVNPDCSDPYEHGEEGNDD